MRVLRVLPRVAPRLGAAALGRTRIFARPASLSPVLASRPEEFDLLSADEEKTHIQGYDDFGFNVNGISMRGSILCFPTFTLLWDCQTLAHASPDALSVVSMIKPKIQILLLGTGESMRNVNPELFGFFSRKGISIEHMTTKHAISTFNVLNAEGRGVAAALLSLHPVTREEACFYTSGTPYVETTMKGGAIVATPAATPVHATPVRPKAVTPLFGENPDNLMDRPAAGGGGGFALRRGGGSHRS